MSGNSSASDDLRWMRRALALARRGQGLTHPNPRVGAVLVGRNRVLGEGFHARAGEPHAEVNAIRAALAAGKKIEGSTLYVTLEPCSTHGRTPPCTELILHHRIKRVVAGATDPNPRHAGRGFRLLRRAGIAVTEGVLSEESEALNEDFNHWMATGLPFVTAKIALSVDGRISPRETDSRWLTSEKSRQQAHELRWQADAIMVGAETARADNPRLTVRLPGRRGKRQPWRIVFARDGRLPGDLSLFTDAHRDRTLIFRKKTFRQVMKEVGARQITHVLLEGGGHLLAAAFEARLVNRVAFFVAPCVLGTDRLAVAGWPGIVASPVRLHQAKYVQMGPDLYGEARVRFAGKPRSIDRAGVA